jgi:hypothetical protein
MNELEERMMRQRAKLLQRSPPLSPNTLMKRKMAARRELMNLSPENSDPHTRYGARKPGSKPKKKVQPTKSTERMPKLTNAERSKAEEAAKQLDEKEASGSTITKKDIAVAAASVGIPYALLVLWIRFKRHTLHLTEIGPFSQRDIVATWHHSWEYAAKCAGLSAVMAVLTLGHFNLVGCGNMVEDKNIDMHADITTTILP